jgi:hypothetical protein
MSLLHNGLRQTLVQRFDDGGSWFLAHARNLSEPSLSDIWTSADLRGLLTQVLALRMVEPLRS